MNNQINQAVTQVKPLTFNEDATPETTIEILADYEVNMAGNVIFGSYSIAVGGDGPTQLVALGGDNTCQCAVCKFLYLIEAHAEAVNENEAGAKWLKITQSVRDYFAAEIVSRGGHVDAYANPLDLFVQFAGLQSQPRESVTLDSVASPGDLQDISGNIVQEGDAHRWLGEYHHTGRPVFQLQNKVLFVDDIMASARANGQELMSVVEARK